MMSEEQAQEMSGMVARNQENLRSAANGHAQAMVPR